MIVAVIRYFFYHSYSYEFTEFSQHMYNFQKCLPGKHVPTTNINCVRVSVSAN